MRPEIGTPEIIAAGMHAAADLHRLQAQTIKSGREPRNIEGGMNGVAGARMIQRKFEQRLGRQAGARAAKPDARRRQVPADRATNGTAAPAVSSLDYSAGTEASRSRIE